MLVWRCKMIPRARVLSNGSTQREMFAFACVYNPRRGHAYHVLEERKSAEHVGNWQAASYETSPLIRTQLPSTIPPQASARGRAPFVSETTIRASHSRTATIDESPPRFFLSEHPHPSPAIMAPCRTFHDVRNVAPRGQ